MGLASIEGGRATCGDARREEVCTPQIWQIEKARVQDMAGKVKAYASMGRVLERSEMLAKGGNDRKRG